MTRSLFGLRAKFIGIVFICVIGTTLFTAHYILEKEQALLMEGARRQALSLARASAVLFTNTFIYEELGVIDSADAEAYLAYYVSDVMQTDPRILAFTVMDNNGHPVVQADSHQEHAAEISTSTVHQLQMEQRGTGADARLEISLPLSIESKQWGSCRILFSLRDIENVRITARNEILIILWLCLLASLFVIGFGVDRLVEALQNLSRAMEQITIKKNFFGPLPDLPDRNDEIGHLQRSFKWMVQRLREEEEERARTRKQLFHTDKMATIGSLTASIAHEINNPLAGVILCFNNLVKGKLDGQARKQHVEVIGSGLERIRNIMRDLLDYSRQSALNIQPAAPAELVEKSLSLLEPLAAKSHIKLEVDLPAKLPAVAMDAQKMQQVLVNLLVNAFDAMPDGGTLRLHAEIDDKEFGLVVADTGNGIPEDVRAKIFDPFYTTKGIGKGTGLGLALGKSIVEQHGGRLELRSSDTSGSVFAIHLPRYGKEA